MLIIIYLASVTDSDVGHHLTFTLDDNAPGPMQDQFPDQFGGVPVLPESLRGAGGTEVPIDENGRSRPVDEHGERAVEDRLGSHMNDIGDRSDAEGPRRRPAGRSIAWAWVVGTVATALAALAWAGYSHRDGAQTVSATMPPAQVTVSKPLVLESTLG
jgi:hypothetical protein